MIEKTSKLQEEDQFQIRFPKGMRKQFAALAKKNNRSLNAELVHRLSLSLFIPEDVANACMEMVDVQDRLDFAVKLFRRAGVKVEI